MKISIKMEVAGHLTTGATDGQSGRHIGEPFEVNTSRLHAQNFALCSAIQGAESRLNKQRAKCNERQHVLEREGYLSEHESGDCDCHWAADYVKRLNGLHSTINCILLQTDKYENG